MTSKPLIIDNSIETGPVNFTFLNNREEARRHIYDARKFLASVKSKYGVYDRVAAGDPGGFFHESIDLPDGTRISVATNDGVDTAIIAAFSRVVEEEKKEEEEEYDPKLLNSFFVGIRYISGGNAVSPGSDYVTIDEEISSYEDRFVVPHLCVWVPEKKDDGSGDTLVVSNRDSLIGIPEDPEDPLLDGLYAGPAAGGTAPSILVSHFSNKAEFPLGLFEQAKQKKWLVKELYTDERGVFWDVYITCRGVPPQGRYVIKACIVGGDCLVTTPAKFEISAQLGPYFAKKEFTVSQFTTDVRLIMPKGFFWKGSPGLPEHYPWIANPTGDPNYDWYFENDGAPFNGFPNKSDALLPNGPNPHANNWWQGGLEGILDHEPIIRKNNGFLAVIDGEDKPLLVEGYFEFRAGTNYRDAKNAYMFSEADGTGMPPLKDRCVGLTGYSKSRVWVAIGLDVASQSVALPAYRTSRHECNSATPNVAFGASTGRIVPFVNLGSSNESGFIVDIPGIAPGTLVTFYSPTSNRTILATQESIPSAAPGQISIGNRGNLCEHGSINYSSTYTPDENPLVDIFYVSMVATFTEVAEGAPFYFRRSSISYVLDGSLQTTPLNESRDENVAPYLEEGAFSTMKSVSGYYKVLEKLWSMDK